MNGRLYHPGDGPLLDRLIEGNRKGDVRLERDRIVLAGESGCLIWRPACFVHEFHCGKSLARAEIAKALLQSAKSDAAHNVQEPQEAVFLIEKENCEMERFLTRLGAQKETGEIYTIPLYLL